MTYTKANRTHCDHGDNVEPCALEPLAKARASLHAVGIMMVAATVCRGCRGSVPVRVGAGVTVGDVVGAIEETHDADDFSGSCSQVCSRNSIL